VARLVGLDLELVRAVARVTLIDTPLGAIARELAACRADLPRAPKGRART
jgi:hypothetical protein